MLVVALLPAAAHAAETVALPFAGGRAVRVIQGYAGGTHTGRSQYGLDLVLGAGATSGAEVLSPVDGTVAWAYAPGTRNGCVAIALRGGGHSVMLCHVVLGRAFARGESVARGQVLGTVGPPGAVGNNGTPHVHFELHRGALARSPVPFSPPAGLSLDGVDLPATGARNEHGGRAPIVSTNGGPSAASPAAPARPAPSTRSERSAAAPEERPAPVVAPAPRPPAAQPTPLAAAPPVAAKAVPARAAVVRGTGSCLVVRSQPGLGGAAKSCLADGTEVPLSASSKDADGRRWREVEGVGWAAADYLVRTRAVVVATGDCLNVRARPSTDAAVVACLPEGTAVVLGGAPASDGGLTWYRVQRAGAVERDGWVAGEFLE